MSKRPNLPRLRQRYTDDLTTKSPTIQYCEKPAPVSRESSEAPEHGVLTLASAPRRKRMIGANNVRPALFLVLNRLHLLPIA
jgi:hypothetical protein